MSPALAQVREAAVREAERRAAELQQAEEEATMSMAQLKAELTAQVRQ